MKMKEKFIKNNQILKSHRLEYLFNKRKVILLTFIKKIV